MLVSDGWGLGRWHLTGFYGNPETTRRPESWAKLKHLKGVAALPWLVIRDFNELTSLSEKEGGGERPRQQMDNFIDVINFCDLKDIGFVGPRFTWIYQKADGTQIRERLDRALATAKWLELFPAAKLYHQSTSASDHSMLLLRMVAGSKRKRVKRSFKFESMWLKESSCEEVVRSAWEEGVIASSDWELNSCLKICRDRLEEWNKDVFGHVGRNISDLQRRLEWLESQPSNPELIQALKFTRAELNCWLEKEDTMWRQRARLNWFQGGDRNTSFFHTKASSRQRKNLIEGLMDADGVWQEDEGKIEEVVVEYYNNLFTSSSPLDFSELLQAIQSKLTPSMNQMLLKPFTGEEVRLALKQMHPLKAPGPNGMPPLFF